MRKLQVVSIEEHLINNEKAVIVGIKRIHRYSDLSDSLFSFNINNKELTLTIEKENKKKEYLIDIFQSDIDFSLLEAFMVIELSDKIGNINYIVEKNKK